MKPDDIVTVQPPPVVTLAVGETAVAHLRVAVADGYHIQANPASDPFLIPARLELKPKMGVRARNPQYPPARPYRLAGTSSDLRTYDGTFEIIVPFEAGERTQPGDRALSGILRYQACDARSCLFPASIPVSLTVRVVPTAIRPAEPRPAEGVPVPSGLRGREHQNVQGEHLRAQAQLNGCTDVVATTSISDTSTRRS
jgi:hypothetical protein